MHLHSHAATALQFRDEIVELVKARAEKQRQIAHVTLNAKRIKATYEQIAHTLEMLAHDLELTTFGPAED